MLTNSETPTHPPVETVAVPAGRRRAFTPPPVVRWWRQHDDDNVWGGGSANIDLWIQQMALFLWTQHPISLLHQLLDV